MDQFTGNSKQKRSIALGGSRGVSTSKKSTVEQARMEREQRQKSKKENGAATRIQAWYRGICSRRQLSARYETELTDLVATFDWLGDDTPSGTSKADITHLTGLYLSSSRQLTDAMNSSILNIIQKSIRDSDASCAYPWAALTPAGTSTWLSQACRLIDHAVERLCVRDRPGIAPVLADIIRSLCDCSLWGPYSQAIEAIQKGCSALAWKLVKHLCRDDSLFHRLLEPSHVGELSDTVQETILAILLRPISSAKFCEKNCRIFYTFIVHVFGSAMGASQVHPCLRPLVLSPDFLTRILNTTDHPAFWHYCTTVSNPTLVSGAIDNLLELSNRCDAGTVYAQVGSVFVKFVEYQRRVDSSKLSADRLFRDVATIKVLLHPLIAPESTSNIPHPSLLAVSGTKPPLLAVCEALAKLLRTSDLKMSVLSTLAFSANVSRPMWGWIKRDFYRVLEDRPSRSLYLVVELFCATYGHLLQVMDNSEFYSDEGAPRANVFSPAELIAMSSCLKDLQFNLFWSPEGPTGTTFAKPVFATTAELESVRSAIGALLDQLYERDDRRSFCPADHWHLQDRQVKQRLDLECRALVDGSAQEAWDSNSRNRAAQILAHMPYVIPRPERVALFRDACKSLQDPNLTLYRDQVKVIKIRRTHLVSDGYHQLTPLGPALRHLAVKVIFINEQGIEEAGIDGGGVFREWFELCVNTAFDPKFGLFEMSADTNELHPRPVPAWGKFQGVSPLQYMNFLGRMLGKALRDGFLLDLTFKSFFLRRWLGQYNSIDDLATLDTALHKNLLFLKNYEGDVADLCLEFTTAVEVNGKVKTIPLCYGGEDMDVTNTNRLHYILLTADFRLNKQVEAQVQAFLFGLSHLVDKSWIQLFNATELQFLISGDRDQDLDVDDLQRNTKYSGGYSASSSEVKWFFKCLREFTNEERRATLRFVTSCSRPPLLGFEHLNPPFTIHKVDTHLGWFSWKDSDRLPSAATCFNMLKLPSYKRRSTLKDKLKYAIMSGAGFEMS